MPSKVEHFPQKVKMVLDKLSNPMEAAFKHILTKGA